MPLGDLPVPATVSLGELPVPDTGLGGIPAQQRDAEAFQATSGEVGKGLRSSVNSLGATFHAFVGGGADAMGLTQFANERFKEAEDYVKFADAVGPVVRDYRAVKDFNDAAMFAAGLAGQAVGSSLPAAVLGPVGAARFGLRGAVAGAAAGSFVPETGEAVLTTKDEKASPQKKFAVAAGKGAINAALDTASLAVPASAVMKGLKGAAQPVAKTVAKAIGAEGITEGAQEIVGQKAHEIINPNRDASGDVPATINAALGGAVGGAVLGGGAGIASKAGSSLAKFRTDNEAKLGKAADIPSDRTQTVDEAKAAMSQRDRVPPLDPDIASMPDDVEHISDALDAHDATVDKSMAREWDGVKDQPAYKQYEGWEKDATKREALHEALSKRHIDEVDKPLWRKAAESVGKFVEGLRPADDGAKKSERRTALDVYILDEVSRHLPDDVRNGLSPAERQKLADDVKQYAMHTAGLKDEQPGPGAPEQRTERNSVSELAATGEQGKPYKMEGPREKTRAVPHGLMDLFGDKLDSLVEKVQTGLTKGGVPLAKPITKPELKRAEKRRGERLGRMEEIVLAHIKPEISADAATRNYVVKEMTTRLRNAAQDGVKDWGKFNQELDYVFGKDAQHVLEEFDKQREDVTQGYEDMGDNLDPRTDETTAERLKRNEQFRVTEEDEGDGALPISEAEPNPTGEQPASRQEQAHPYRDKRLGVAMDETALRTTLDALHSEYDPRDVRFRIEPEVKDNQMTGKFILHAEDAEAKVGFTKEELARIRDNAGVAGHENSVVSVVVKDPDDPKRNKTVPVSIPNLVAETIRTTHRRGSGGAYVHDMVMEGLSRLASDPEFVRFAPSSEKEGWNFPDKMLVAIVKGEKYTWGQVRKEADTARSTEKDYYSTVVKELNERLEEAKADGDIHPFDKALGRFPNRMSQYADLRAKVERGAKGAKQEYNAFVRKYARNQEEVKSGFFTEAKRRGNIPNKDGVYPDNVDPGPGMTSTEELQDAAEKRAADEPREATLDSTRTIKPDLAASREAKAKFRKDAGLDLKKPKLSEMRLGAERITAEQAREVRAEIERLLGPDVAVKLLDGMDSAGKFANIKGVETIGVSIHSLDPLGTARHEALHGVFARIMRERPDLANLLSNAARSPNVIAQLRRLLADEPAALKQLADHEERAAYMYEFWAAKKLQIGPKAEGVFDTVKQYLAKAMHLIFGLGEDPATQAKAEMLLRAFHSGEMADRSATGRVLSKLAPRDMLENTWLARVGDWSNRVWSTADGYVRDQKIPAFTDVADKMFNPGEGKPGLVQARHIARHQFMNRYAQATKGLDDAGLSRVLNALQTGSDEGTGRLVGESGVVPSGPAARGYAAEAAAVRAIRGVLDDLYTYMQEKKVRVVEWNEDAHQYDEHPLQKVANFFPRAYSKEAIAANWDAFVALLQRHGIANPEAVAQQLVSPTKASPDESDFTSGLTHYAPNTMARKLKIPDAELAPFMKKDLGSIMYDYINYTTRRGEYAVRFGNQGQEIAKVTGWEIKKDGGSVHVPGSAEKQGATPEQMKSFGKYVQAMEGSLGNKIDPRLRKFMGAVLTYQNFRLLPLSLFSSLIDPLGIGVRGGTATEAFTAFTRGIRDLVSTKDDAARELARAVGTINEATEEHMVSDMYGANYGANWQKWLNNKLFKLNGMESWNNSMRTAATAAAQEFIIRHVNQPGKHSERYLRELGLTKDDIRIDGGQLELTPAVVDALNKWVDGAVLRPHAGIRPIWQSDPHFMLVSHLKQFTYSFQKTINERVAHEAMNGNYTPLLVLSSYVPFIIASDVLRAALTPGGMDDSRMKTWALKDWLLHGVNRAGLSGPGQYALDSYSDMQRSPGIASGALQAITDVAGPTAQQLRDLMKAAAGSGSMARQGLRALPIVPAMGM